MPNEFDVIVVGGGLSGRALTLAAVAAGHRVAQIESPGSMARSDEDPRTTALLPETVDWFASLGLGSTFEEVGAPLRSLEIRDLPRHAQATRFAGHELGVDWLALNVPNGALAQGLASAAGQRGASRREDTVVRIDAHEDRVSVRLAGALQPLRARLVVLATGDRSQLADDLGFRVRVRDWGRTALAFFAEARERPQGVSIEGYGRGASMTLVPGRDRHVSVIWIDHPEVQRTRLASGPGALIRDASRFLGSPYGGLLETDGPLGRFDVVRTRATRLARGRVLVAGEAAHRLPPLGAQGFNLSARDAKVLADLLAQTTDPGVIAGLYERHRLPDLYTTVAAVDALAAFAVAPARPIHALRTVGLQAMARWKAVRTATTGVGLLRRA